MLQDQIFLGHAWLEKCPKLVSEAVFKERATENDEKAGTEPYAAAPKIRENAWFSQHVQKNREEHNACWNRKAKNARKRVVLDDF